MTTPLTARQIWSMPLALAVVTAVGLMSALLGDGFWDVLSWVSLVAPMIVILRCAASSRSRTGRSLP
jgi:predicted cobalt transporter CbtA